MQNGVPQNPGALNKSVETLANQLKQQNSWLLINPSLFIKYECFY